MQKNMSIRNLYETLLEIKFEDGTKESMFYPIRGNGDFDKVWKDVTDIYTGEPVFFALLERHYGKKIQRKGITVVSHKEL